MVGKENMLAQPIQTPKKIVRKYFIGQKSTFWRTI